MHPSSAQIREPFADQGTMSPLVQLISRRFNQRQCGWYSLYFCCWREIVMARRQSVSTGLPCELRSCQEERPGTILNATGI